MASPRVPITSTRLIVNATPIPNQPPQIQFSAQIFSPLETLFLGPLTAEQFTAIASMLQVPGQVLIERQGPNHILVKQTP